MSVPPHLSPSFPGTSMLSVRSSQKSSAEPLVPAVTRAETSTISSAHFSNSPKKEPNWWTCFAEWLWSALNCLFCGLCGANEKDASNPIEQAKDAPTSGNVLLPKVKRVDNQSTVLTEPDLAKSTHDSDPQLSGSSSDSFHMQNTQTDQTKLPSGIDTQNKAPIKPHAAGSDRDSNLPTLQRSLAKLMPFSPNDLILREGIALTQAYIGIAITSGNPLTMSSQLPGLKETAEAIEGEVERLFREYETTYKDKEKIETDLLRLKDAMHKQEKTDKAKLQYTSESMHKSESLVHDSHGSMELLAQEYEHALASKTEIEAKLRELKEMMAKHRTCSDLIKSGRVVAVPNTQVI